MKKLFKSYEVEEIYKKSDDRSTVFKTDTKEILLSSIIASKSNQGSFESLLESSSYAKNFCEKENKRPRI